MLFILHDVSLFGSFSMPLESLQRIRIERMKYTLSVKLSSIL